MPIGTFFALTVLVEGWSLAECKYQLPRAKLPKFLPHSRVTFGKGLEWDLDNAGMFGRVDVMLESEKFFWSNSTPPRLPGHQHVSSGPSYPPSPHARSRRSGMEIPWLPCRTDMIAQFNGGPFDQIPFMVGQLYSCLFYVELLGTPSFYTSPQECFVQVNCRIPPGPSLVDFLFKLRRKNACFHYRGSEPQYTEATACTPGLLEKCKMGSPYSRKLDLEVDSIDSLLEFKLDGIGIGLHELSNFPYRLGQLMYDQGLVSPFGRTDHVYTTRDSKKSTRLDVALERLQSRLDNVRWTI